MTLRIAHFADTHLDYSAHGKTNPDGINTRVQDGYDALTEIVQGIINHPKKIDYVIHGGDITHTSQPTVRTIYEGNRALRAFHKAGIPFYGVAGNHDASDIRANLPSVAAFHDPDRNINMLYDPYARVELADGVLLHAISHHGLHANETPEFEVSSENINIFTTHGAALDPKNKTLLHCIDSPREQIIPTELITEGLFQISLLGHYHSRHAVGGEHLNTWYSGSTVRRGFVDEPGARGWLLIEVEPNGKVTVTPQNIRQRPQFDLPTIDAQNLTASEVMDLLQINLETTVGLEQDPIVRQRIVNSTRLIKEGIDHEQLNEWKKHTLAWQLEHIKQEEADSTTVAGISLKDKRSINIIDNYKRFTDERAKTVPEEYREIVITSAEKYLKEARDLAALED